MLVVTVTVAVAESVAVSAAGSRKMSVEQPASMACGVKVYSVQRRVYEAAQVRSSKASRGDMSNHVIRQCESPGFQWHFCGRSWGNVGAACEHVYICMGAA